MALFGKSVALQLAISYTTRKCYKREFCRVIIIINLIDETSGENGKVMVVKFSSEHIE
jgi:hypothetical protein